MTKEPVTGQARELEIQGVNLNVSYQETLKTTEGKEIMKGEVKNFNLGHMPPMGDPAGQSDAEQKKKEVIKEKIAELVAEYLNS